MNCCGTCCRAASEPAAPPVNFAYHAMKNGTEGWAISAVGEDELGDELIAKANEAAIHHFRCAGNHDFGTRKTPFDALIIKYLPLERSDSL